MILRQEVRVTLYGSTKKKRNSEKLDNFSVSNSLTIYQLNKSKIANNYIKCYTGVHFIFFNFPLCCFSHLFKKKSTAFRHF